MQDATWLEEEMVTQGICETGCEPVQNGEREEGRDVRQDKLAGDAGEGWEAQRDGAGAGHWLLSYFILAYSILGAVAGYTTQRTAALPNFDIAMASVD